MILPAIILKSPPGPPPGRPGTNRHHPAGQSRPARPGGPAATRPRAAAAFLSLIGPQNVHHAEAAIGWMPKIMDQYTAFFFI
jgi:hypothetical protein